MRPSVVLMHPSKNFIPATDSAFRFEGRIDLHDRVNPVLIWQGSQVRMDFEGDSLAMQFGACKGVCFFDATLDGVTNVVEVRESAVPVEIKLEVPRSGGRHQWALFKRSEADAGQVVFQGVELAAGAKVFVPKPAASKLAMQFFGDSITVGACNEDGAEDQWENRRSHNNALSYAALTAKALHAGYRNIAVSGMGIVVGYVPKRAGEIWDRLYPEPGAPKAEEPGWSPDVVCVNYGENDDSFSKNAGEPFPVNFAEGYVALVKAMRVAYPKAEIVLLRGGMFGGARSETFRNGWELAVQRLEEHDSRMHHFVFQHWSMTHPRVPDHRAMADELVLWLKTQPFMQRFL